MLTHPNTVTLFDYGRTTDGVFYCAMELLEGTSLQEVMLVDRQSSPARLPDAPQRRGHDGQLTVTRMA